MGYDDDLDRALASEQEILPSSGFLGGVMETVQREASAPPPIPFPWKRALPGMVAGVLAVGIVEGMSVTALVRGGSGGTVELPAQAASILHAVQNVGAGWILMALAISFACVKLTTGFATVRTKN